MTKICPKCKFEIDCLDFDVTATCKSQLYANESGDYDIDCLTDNAQYDNFSCPNCNEVLFETEEEAIKFMSDDNE